MGAVLLSLIVWCLALGWLGQRSLRPGVKEPDGGDGSEHGLWIGWLPYERCPGQSGVTHRRISTYRDALHASSSERCKWKPQWAATLHILERWKLRLTIPSVAEDVEQLECSYTADGSVRDTKSILPYINYTLVICYMFSKLCSYQNRKVSLIHKVKKHAKWCYILLRDMCTCSKSIFTFFVCVSPKPQVKGSGYFRDERGIKSGKGIPFVGSVFFLKLGTHMLIDLFFYIS